MFHSSAGLVTFARVKWILGFVLLCARLSAATLTVATYNLEFYVDAPTLGVEAKSPESRRLIRRAIVKMNPDIIALEEVGSTNALRELVNALQNDGLSFPYSDFVRGPDTNLHLAFLSKLPILARRPHTNENFLYGGHRFHVARGFAEIDVGFGRDRRVTLISAHLKSKRQAGEADQQALREEEAALLREHIDDFFKRQPAGNLIVLGDLNDDISSRTLRTILGRGSRRLYDPRPAEQNGDLSPNPNSKFQPRRILWTHYFGRDDTYSRLDYILVSPNLRSFVDPTGTYVLAMPDWGAASDHRPVAARLRLPD